MGMTVSIFYTEKIRLFRQTPKKICAELLKRAKKFGCMKD